ncbi:hypothetical protein TIFTF001_012858 [Ficus carica]|uniref:Casein kinase substrate phosphoprotein PP28 domain-containing protein n=1 Tax=Ficus carica TaxID=3494 RepID=A0AA88D5H5_FICCA|nr:hypothetical protein TIFTF001_012858 [Ficus carica]
MGRGKYKSKPTGHRQFSTPEELLEYKEEEEVEEESGEESEEEDGNEKRKGIEGIIEIENPNLAKTKAVKVRDIDMGKTTELSRQRLSLIRQQRAEAAKKREEEKAVKEQKKAEARK